MNNAQEAQNAIERKYRLPLNIQLFAEGDPEPEPEPSPEPTPKTVTMTQDELDALIGREKAKAKKPYADYDEMKTKLTELETAEAERQKAEMTEQERMQAELEAAKKKAEEAEGKSAAALEAANQRVIKADFKLAATGVNIRPDVIDDAFLLVDKSGISVDDTGNVVGVKEALEALVAAKPYLVAAGDPSKPKQIGDPNNPKPDEKKTLEAQLDDAKKRKDFAKVIELSNKLNKLK